MIYERFITKWLRVYIVKRSNLFQIILGRAERLLLVSRGQQVPLKQSSSSQLNKMVVVQEVYPDFTIQVIINFQCVLSVLSTHVIYLSTKDQNIRLKFPTFYIYYYVTIYIYYIAGFQT